MSYDSSDIVVVSSLILFYFLLPLALQISGWIKSRRIESERNLGGGGSVQFGAAGDWLKTALLWVSAWGVGAVGLFACKVLSDYLFKPPHGECVVRFEGIKLILVLLLGISFFSIFIWFLTSAKKNFVVISVTEDHLLIQCPPDVARGYSLSSIREAAVIWDPRGYRHGIRITMERERPDGAQPKKIGEFDILQLPILRHIFHGSEKPSPYYPIWIQPPFSPNKDEKLAAIAGFLKDRGVPVIEGSLTTTSFGPVLFPFLRGCLKGAIGLFLSFACMIPLLFWYGWVFRDDLGPLRELVMFYSTVILWVLFSFFSPSVKWYGQNFTRAARRKLGVGDGSPVVVREGFFFCEVSLRKRDGFGVLRSAGDAIVLAVDGWEWVIARGEVKELCRAGRFCRLEWQGEGRVHEVLLRPPESVTFVGGILARRRFFRWLKEWRDGGQATFPAPVNMRRGRRFFAFGVGAVMLLLLLHNYLIDTRLSTGRWKPRVKRDISQLGGYFGQVEALPTSQVLMIEKDSSLSYPERWWVVDMDKKTARFCGFDLYRNYQYSDSPLFVPLENPFALLNTSNLFRWSREERLLNVETSLSTSVRRFVNYSDHALYKNTLLFSSEFTSYTEIVQSPQRDLSKCMDRSMWSEWSPEKTRAEKAKVSAEGAKLLMKLEKLDRQPPMNTISIWKHALEVIDLQTKVSKSLGKIDSMSDLPPTFFPDGKNVLYHWYIIDVQNGAKRSLVLPETFVPGHMVFANQTFRHGNCLRIRMCYVTGEKLSNEVWEIDPERAAVSVIERLPENEFLVSADDDRWLLAGRGREGKMPLILFDRGRGTRKSLGLVDDDCGYMLLRGRNDIFVNRAGNPRLMHFMP